MANVIPEPVAPELIEERDRLRGETNPGLPANLMTPPSPPREFKDRRPWEPPGGLVRRPMLRGTNRRARRPR